MVIDDLDLLSLPVVPDKADSPLVIDSYTPLPSSISPEFLQPISRWDSHVIQSDRPVQHPKLPQGNLLDVRGKPTGTLSMKNLFGFFIFE